jgi:hypothetical protein
LHIKTTTAARDFFLALAKEKGGLGPAAEYVPAVFEERDSLQREVNELKASIE